MDSRSRFRHRFKLVVQLVAVLLVTSTCGILDVPDIPSNPMDPSDPIFQPPSVIFPTGPIEGETIDTCYVLLAWSGNQPEMSFSYQMDSEGWSDWAGDTSTIYPYLDEGTHTFQIKSRYYNGVESQGAESLSFEIDDIQGPALRFYPRYKIVSFSSSFSLDVFLDEVVNIAGVKAAIAFDPAYLRVDRIDVYEDGRSLLKQNDGTVIPFYSYNNTSGSILIEVGTATGSPAGVSGSGAIASLTFTTLQAFSTEVTFVDGSEFRDPENVKIDLYESVATLIDIR